MNNRKIIPICAITDEKLSFTIPALFISILENSSKEQLYLEGEPHIDPSSLDSKNKEDDSKYGKEEDYKNAHLKTDFNNDAKKKIKTTLKYIGKEGYQVTKKKIIILPL